MPRAMPATKNTATKTPTTATKKVVRKRRVVKKKAATPATEPTTAVESLDTVQETPAETPVVEETPVTVVEETPGGTRRRREINAETYDARCEELKKRIEDEIDFIKSGERHGTGIKFLKSVLKETKGLQSDAKHLSKKKKRRVNNTNGGFQKKVPVTAEMLKFLNQDADTLMSRADVTKGLQAYILSKKLQNQENRREILPDRALTKLLRYKKATHGPLMYYTLQKLIQQHFVKAEA